MFLDSAHGARVLLLPLCFFYSKVGVLRAVRSFKESEIW